MTSPDENDHDLARTLAKVQYHYQQAIEELATGRKDAADYQLSQAYLALEDYLVEDGDSE